MVLLGQQPVGGADLRQRAAPVKAERGVVVGLSALQVPSLLGDGVHVSFIDDWRLFPGRQQMRALEETAEIFFAGDDLGAGLAGEAGMGFVFHFQPFEPDDADKLPVFFPDLGLGKFHDIGNRNKIPRRVRRGGIKVAEEVCLSCFNSGETITGHRHFFFAPFLAAAFFGAGLLALDFTTFFAIMLL